MDLLHESAQILGRIRGQRPLIHQLTNFVTVNDCANVTLAIGASPVMANDPGEVADMVSHARALVLNIGTLQSELIESMLLAGRRACELGIPVIFDPVGAGATRLRTAAAERIIKEIPLAVIRGNMSEIKTLAGSSEGIQGVDSTAGTEGGEQLACALSRRLNAVVAVTGPVDLIVHGDKLCRIHNGHPLLASVTGTGFLSSDFIVCAAAV